MHLAALLGRVEVVRILIENDFPINSRDKTGYSACHEAARKGRVDVIKLLFDKGSDINIKNNDGDTPLSEGKLSNINQLIANNINF